jgi:uncharacterized membrane protein YvbJ
MKCENCGRVNPDDAKFCADCGADLQQTKIIHHSTDCPLCGYESTPESRFCAECGAGLGRPHREETKKHHHDQNAPKKKKRQLTRSCTGIQWRSRSLSSAASFSSISVLNQLTGVASRSGRFR